MVFPGDPLQTSNDPLWYRGLLLLFCFLLVAVLHISVAASLPKYVSLHAPEAFLLRHHKLIRLLSRLLAFPNFLIRILLRPLLSLFKVPEDVALHSHYLPAELPLIYAENKPEAGEEEQAMIRGVVGFSDTVVREVMTPRADMQTLSVDDSLDEVLCALLKTGHSRFPVTGSSTDDIRGVLLAKDLWPIFVESARGEFEGSFSLRNLLRPAFFVSDAKPIDQLLEEFKRQSQHLAVVLDEHGGVDGVVTLEDLVEEIVGDIFDESDIPKLEISLGSEGELNVGGRSAGERP